MKTCHYCSTKIPWLARKCPNCTADLKDNSDFSTYTDSDRADWLEIQKILCDEVEVNR